MNPKFLIAVLAILITAGPTISVLQAQDPILQAVPYLRYAKQSAGRQWWTTDPAEKGNRPQWQLRAIEGHMSMYPTLGSSMPFYRHYDPLNGNRFWTTDTSMGDACKRCLIEGTVGYLMATPEHPDLVPLYRCFNPSTGKHFWSIQLWRCENHGDLEGIVGYVFANSHDQLFQSFWRGNEGLGRTVPVVAGDPQWSDAGDWDGSVSASDLDGEGDLQALANYIIGDTLYQSYWRGNQGWLRTVLVADGTIEWNNASVFSGPFVLSDLPGSGNMQGTTNYVVGSTLYQDFWRGNQGWSRTVPISGTLVEWDEATDWAGPYAASDLPGEGNVQAIDVFVFEDTLTQTFWRGGEGRSRTIPIDGNGSIDFNAASDWDDPVAVADLPGSGTMQALSGYSLPPRIGLF